MATTTTTKYVSIGLVCALCGDTRYFHQVNNTGAMMQREDKKRRELFIHVTDKHADEGGAAQYLILTVILPDNMATDYRDSYRFMLNSERFRSFEDGAARAKMRAGIR